jgi:hypothetical protein
MCFQGLSKGPSFICAATSLLRQVPGKFMCAASSRAPFNDSEQKAYVLWAE